MATSIATTFTPAWTARAMLANAVSPMYAAFTKNARKVLELAHQESERYGYLGTEHLLLGLVDVDNGTAVEVLAALKADTRNIRLAIANLAQGMKPFDCITSGEVPKTPRARNVIAYAEEEARNVKHDYVGTEHILLGLLREQEAPAAQILLNCGLTLEAVRARIPAVLARRKREGRQ
jgi:ATP-dependent Clp protease ATP-binding subunit ClpC